MTDDDKKKNTLCIFITPLERVKAQDGVVEYFARDSENYFKKLIAPGPLPLEYAADILNQDGIAAVSGNNVKNVQMIFDIHGDKEGLSISEEEMHKILLPILYALGDKKLEIIMANCQGSLKFKGSNDHGSLPEYLKDMAKTYNVKPENISLYCMPKGHDAYIGFNNNGDIFFVSNDASSIRIKHENNTTIDSFYKKEHQEEGKPNTRITYNKDYVEIQAEKPFDEKDNKQQPVLQGVYKGRPPIKIDINTGKPFSNDIVPYKPPLVSTMKPANKQGRWQKVKVTKKIKKEPDNYEPSISGQTNKQGIWQKVKVTKKIKKEPDNYEPSISGKHSNKRFDQSK